MYKVEFHQTVDVLLPEIFINNGPDEADYQLIFSIIDQIGADEIEILRNKMRPILNPGTIIGFSFTKPFGYNGDFFIIEKIYQNYISTDPRYKKWDEFFHTFPAAIAVVNRKKLAKDILYQLHTNSVNNHGDVLIPV